MNMTKLRGAGSVILWAGVSLCLPTLAVTEEEEKVAERPEISGSWERNERLSDDPRQVMKAAMEKSGGGRSGGGMGGRGGGMGGRGGGMGGPGGSMGRRDGPGGERGGGGGLREMMSASGSVEIEVDETEIRMDMGGERLRILRPDDRKRHREGPGGSKLETRCRWEEGQLVIESKGERGMKVRETYSLIQEGQMLAVTVRLENSRLREPVEFRSYYERAVEETLEDPTLAGPPAP